MYRRLILNSVNDVIHAVRYSHAALLLVRIFSPAQQKKKKETDRLCPADSLNITISMNDYDQVVHIHMEQR